MRFEGECLIPSPPEMVWQGLNDPEVLRRSIPGCESMERTGDNEFTATVAIGVGPISARFKGKVEILDPDPPHSFTIRGRGQGGAAGFASGGARISLTPQDDGTRLSYVADADVGGRIASLGGRLIQSFAKKTADDFFARFSDVVTSGGQDEPEPRLDAPDGNSIRPTAAAAGHIPMIDRTAWLLVGLALGVAITFFAG